MFVPFVARDQLIPGHRVVVWFGGRGRKSYAVVVKVHLDRVCVKYAPDQPNGTWIEFRRILSVEVEDQETLF
jgi:hypothetical protein